MNFDFGEVLGHAAQITWKHKILWLITALPFLIPFLLLPLWLALVFTQDFDPERLAGLIENQNVFPFLIILYLVVLIISVFLQILSRASVTLGVYKVETSIQPINLGDLLTSGLQYFWRILGVSLLIGAAFIAFFIIFTVIVAVLSAITMGLAAFCLQPLFLLMIPLILLVMVVMEQAEAAVVADNMGVTDALGRGYELLKANIGKYILVALILYFGMNILISFITVPLMIPMFWLMTRNMEAGMDFSNMIRMQAAFSVVIIPLMTLVQAVALTYMKSAMIVMYLRLTRPLVSSQPVLLEATA